MSNPCCICGLVLAIDDSDFPQWTKDIRALCRIDHKIVLSDTGAVDGGSNPFNIPLPHYGPRQFTYRCSDSSENFCYPFHAVCWSIVHEIDQEMFDNGLDALFNIFESAHYDRKGSRCLSWGQDLYLHEICHALPITEDFAESINPSVSIEILQISDSTFPHHISTNSRKPDLDISTIPHTYKVTVPTAHGLKSLPTEIFESMICLLDYTDVLHLLKSSSDLYRRYGCSSRSLPFSFWKSRFWIFNETAFASSIRPVSCSYKDWYFSIITALQKGPSRLHLQNRKRLWKIGLDLVSTMHALANPSRGLYGRDFIPSTNFQGPTANCVATKYGIGSCRELKQVYVSFDRRHSRAWLCGVIPSYIFISHRRLISGLTFQFNDGTIHDVGYISKGHNGHTKLITPMTAPKYLWLVCSHLGLEVIQIDGIGQTHLDHSLSTPGDQVAVTRWPIEDLVGVCAGIDALRIVGISFENSRHSTYQQLDNALWTPLYPTCLPAMCGEDVTALHQLQRQAFAPASLICIEPENGHLIAIMIYSQLGPHAGVTGIRFTYSTGTEHSWGSVNDAASLAFFLREGEHLIEVDVYKTGPVVRHLRFTTNISRKNELMPQRPVNSTLSGECVNYKASEYFTGFCGCFVSSPTGASSLKLLNCFGVVGKTREISLHSIAFPSVNLSTNVVRSLEEMPLGGIQNHGEYKSQLKFTNRFFSIQASLLEEATEYRHVGQVTGLLFRAKDDEGHPKLIGQWTGRGEIYHLEEGEQILAVEFSKTKPRRNIPSRQGLSQIDGMTVVTTRQKVTWNRTTAPRFVVELITEQRGQALSEIFWDFNAIFDRVKCHYPNACT